MPASRRTLLWMASWARLVGQRSSPSQTATEFGDELARHLPSASGEILEITESYVRERWGNESVDDNNLRRSWRRVRQRILRAIFREDRSPSSREDQIHTPGDR